MRKLKSRRFIRFCAPELIKMTNSASRLPHILNVLFHRGYRNIRYFAYVRSNGNPVISLYQEMPHRTQDGFALVYPGRCYSREFDKQFRPYWLSKEDEWLSPDLDAEQAANRFLKTFLPDETFADGCFDVEFGDWLAHVLSVCPAGAIPITEEPVPGGPYGDGPEVTTFLTPIGDPDARVAKSITAPLPPGLRGQIEPIAYFTDQYARAHRPKQTPSGFACFMRKLDKHS